MTGMNQNRQWKGKSHTHTTTNVAHAYRKWQKDTAREKYFQKNPGKRLKMETVSGTTHALPAPVSVTEGVTYETKCPRMAEGCNVSNCTQCSHETSGPWDDTALAVIQVR